MVLGRLFRRLCRSGGSRLAARSTRLWFLAHNYRVASFRQIHMYLGPSASESRQLNLRSISYVLEHKS